MVEELDKETQEDPIPPLPKGFKVVKSNGWGDLPPLPQGYIEKKNLGVTGSVGGGTVGSSKAPSSVSIEPPNPKDNPFGIGQQFNKPPKLEAEKLDLSNTQHNAAIAEQIKTPLKKIPLTPILDNTKMEKPITEIDKREAERKYKQHQIDMETAIDNTTLKVLKQKGIVAGKGSPYYEAERKKIEEKKFQCQTEWQSGYQSALNEVIFFLEQAKAMEKQQIMKANIDGYEEAQRYGETSAEDYYNETYNK